MASLLKSQQDVKPRLLEENKKKAYYKEVKTLGWTTSHFQTKTTEDSADINTNSDITK